MPRNVPWVAVSVLVLAFWHLAAAPVQNRPPPHRVPGTVVDYSAAESQKYIGSPSIAILPNGHYVASHDFFGKGSTEMTSGQTRLFLSRNRGKAWQHLTDIEGQFWSGLFVHRNALYIMGTSANNGSAIIRRSLDGGKTWTTPRDRKTGLIAGDGWYHTAPVPVVFHAGRIWRAMEDLHPTTAWGKSFRTFVLSAPEGADLLDADNWVLTNRLRFDPAWFAGQNPGWLEGNVVVTPQGSLVNILRVHAAPRYGKAAVVRIAEDGRSISFDPATGFIDFPGGMTKFSIRYDGTSRAYWSLVNPVTNPANPSQRNILALASSTDLMRWTIRSILIQHPGDEDKVGFQYVDWLVEGNDIVAVCRTAINGAHNYHDANHLTFHRIKKFRKLQMQVDSIPFPVQNSK